MEESKAMDAAIIRRYLSPVKLLGLINLMRPKQWVKNAFVLAPLVFSASFLNATAVSHALLVMLLFCLASSAAYILNDMHDIEYDFCHSEKSKARPLATGIVSVSAAVILLISLYVALIWGFGFITPAPKVIITIVAYLMLNLAYTFVLKYQPVVDIFVIAIGFVLRVYAGAVVLNVSLSSWMFMTTLCLALYLASIKRRQELKKQGSSKSRKVLEKYSISLVNYYAEISAIGALIFYSIFVMSMKPELVITMPLVLFGFFRYWFVAEILDAGESPTEALLADWQLLLTVVLWVVACIWVLWPV
jgi:4-hydroxybenzoate polyprenyltransferase